MEMRVVNSIFLMLNVADKLPNWKYYINKCVTYLYSLDVEIPSPNSKWPEAFLFVFGNCSSE